ncbi:helix-turn-helix domain-containing protein [Paenibacillus alba]|uniref:Helix-turn-helix transcriptional regulator n=1 Tax=Paenibacillus alba TaxID=1197127 RepID=A0ABU6G018_9BACL|nr:helix-turn-helix transcriptional regulator [Paenibacillus alba]MEC0226228.1 helix-turn-helix transcriptional regulator [Paenibacillus alba]
MIGLEHIAKVFKCSYSEIGRKIGVTPATVSDWISTRRPITKQNLEKLSDLFKLDERYFSEEINDVDKIEIEIIYLNRLSKKESYQDSYMDSDEEGKEYKAVIWVDPYENELRMKHEELAIEKLVKKMKGILMDESFTSQFREDTHFHLLTNISSLIELDAYSEDVYGQRVPSAVDSKVDALIRMVSLLVYDQNVYGFNGETEGFSYELSSLLQKYNIIPHIEEDETEDIFNQVDPKYSVE